MPDGKNRGEIYCTKCGAANPENASYCKKCSFSLRERGLGKKDNPDPSENSDAKIRNEHEKYLPINNEPPVIKSAAKPERGSYVLSFFLSVGLAIISSPLLVLFLDSCGTSSLTSNVGGPSAGYAMAFMIMIVLGVGLLIFLTIFTIVFAKRIIPLYRSSDKAKKNVIIFFIAYFVLNDVIGFYMGWQAKIEEEKQMAQIVEAQRKRDTARQEKPEKENDEATKKEPAVSVKIKPLEEISISNLTFGRTLYMDILTMDGVSKDIELNISRLKKRLNYKLANIDISDEMKIEEAYIGKGTFGDQTVFITGVSGKAKIKIELGYPKDLIAVITRPGDMKRIPNIVPPVPYRVVIETPFSEKPIDYTGVEGIEHSLDFSPVPDSDYIMKSMGIIRNNECDRNPDYKHSIRFLKPKSFMEFGFNIRQKRYVVLKLDHFSSLDDSCPGNGYSPVTIKVNRRTLVTGFSPEHYNYATDVWDITRYVRQGDNVIRITADDDICTSYWLQSIAVYE